MRMIDNCNNEVWATTLAEEPGFWYLASPYTKCAAGHDAAAHDAALITAELIGEGLHVFSPIAHSHHLCGMQGAPAADNVGAWLGHGLAMLRAATGLIVARLPGWDVSHGVAVEMAFARQTGKPTYFLDAESTSRETMGAESARMAADDDEAGRVDVRDSGPTRLSILRPVLWPRRWVDATTATADSEAGDDPPPTRQWSTVNRMTGQRRCDTCRRAWRFGQPMPACVHREGSL